MLRYLLAMTLDRSCPKLIALDLDGTLLNSDGHLSERSIRVIGQLKAQGVKLILCTGRPPRYIKTLAHTLKLADLVVAYNGAALVNLNTCETEYRHQMSKEKALELLSLMRQQHPEAIAGMETYHGWYLDEALFKLRKPQLLANKQALPDGYGSLETFIKDKVIKIFFRHPSLSAEALSQTLKELELYCTWSRSHLLEVMAPQVNKQEAIAILAERHGFQSSEIAAFGDQINDKELITWAGFGVAMGNACTELKACANFVAATNNEDGVAQVLEQWL